VKWAEHVPLAILAWLLTHKIWGELTKMSLSCRQLFASNPPSFPHTQEIVQLLTSSLLHDHILPGLNQHLPSLEPCDKISQLFLPPRLFGVEAEHDHWVLAVSFEDRSEPSHLQNAGKGELRGAEVFLGMH